MSSRTDHAGAFEKQVRTLCEGFRRAFPASDQPVIFGGRKMTLAEVTATLQQMEESFTAVHQAAMGFRQAVANRRKSMRAHRSTYGDAVVFLKHHLGKESPGLVDFGVRPPKTRQPLTVEAKAIAQAKAAATRKARGILGKRQRQGLGRPPGPELQVLGPDGQPLTPPSEGGSALPAPSEDPEPNRAE